MTIVIIMKKWGANECLAVLLKRFTSHIFTISDGKLLKQHCIICDNAIANEAIKLPKLNGIDIKSINN